jgi:hypothetical protein
MPGGQCKTHHQTAEGCSRRKGVVEWKKMAVLKNEWEKSNIRTPILLRARTSVKVEPLLSAFFPLATGSEREEPYTG